jgi:MFS family permease
MDEKKGSKNVFFVGLLSFFGGISQDVFTPILPIYLTTVLGFDKAFVGIAEGIVAASSNIFKVIAGFFSDKFKKQKPIIFIGYFLSMVARPLLALFTSGAAVIGLRLADGAGKGVKDPAKDVLIAGSAGESTRGKSFGIARMLDTMGSVAGPLILFALLYFLKNSDLLYHYILLFAAVPLIVTLLVLVFKVKETNGNQPQEKNIVSAKNATLPKSFYLFLFIVVLFTLGNSSDAFLILRARNLGITLLEIPIVIALFNLIYASAAVPFGSLSDKIGRIPTMLIGWAAYMLVYLGFAFASSAALVWLLYGLYGIYYATSEGVAKALLADIVESGHHGRAFGIYGMTIGLAALPASFFAGFLWDKIGPRAPFFFGALMSGLALLLLLSFSKKLKPQSV